MEWNLTTIGILLGILFFGYIFGLFEGRSQGYKRRKKEEDAEEREKPQNMVQEDKPHEQAGETNLLSLAEDINQKMHIEIDEQRIDNPPLTPEQRRRLITLLNQIRPWLETGAASTTSEQFTHPGTGAVGMANTSRIATQIPVMNEPSIDDMATAGSMVAQIDKILQVKIIGTSLADRGIRLLESPEGGVSVYIGLTRYNSVADIPDPAIQAAIQSAIAEWENSATTGR